MVFFFIKQQQPHSQLLYASFFTLHFMAGDKQHSSERTHKLLTHYQYFIFKYRDKRQLDQSDAPCHKLHLSASSDWVKQRLCIICITKQAVNHHTTYHDGVNSTYPRTGQHSVDQLWDHGKVDGHPVPLLYSLTRKQTHFSFSS